MEDGQFYKIGVNVPKHVVEENNIYKECVFLLKMVVNHVLDQLF